MAQADTIHHLSQQREQLIQQAEEEKLRWDAERDLWARTSEALLVKRRAGAEALYSAVRFCLIAQIFISSVPEAVHAMGMVNLRADAHSTSA